MIKNRDRKFKILIVDDNVNNVQVLGNILRENGYMVGFASDGIQALEILKVSYDFDLVLLDIDMPVMDGYETCKEIRLDKKLAEMPVIFLTAFSDREMLIKALEYGAQDYVIKPFYSKELILRINTHLEIKHKNELLKSMNHVLEQKVEERTKELNEANKKLANLDNAKNYFIGLLSHELRTPLIGINGNAKMIKEVSTDLDIIESCNDILDSEARLRKFIELALLITSIKAEKVDAIYNEEKLCDFIESSIYKFHKAAQEKNIHILKKNIFEDYYIKVDYSLIAKVFDIVIENAVKFSPQGWEILISGTKTDVDYRVKIKDAGNGFNNDMLEKKFQLLQAGELLSHTEGTGLSLVAAKSIMDLHGFNIMLHNAPEGGALVELVFPLNN